MEFVDHIENCLGPIIQGWSESDDGEKWPFQVAECRFSAIEHATAFVTLGLSHFGLPSRSSKKIIHHELLMIVQSQEDLGLPSILQQIAMEAVNGKFAYLRGDVIGPRGPLFAGSPLTSLYVTMSPYISPEDAVYHDSNGMLRVIAGLLPISTAEARFIATKGWRQFEERFANADDFLDPRRSGKLAL